MTLPDSKSPILGYAVPGRVIKPVNLTVARWALCGSLTSVGIGVALLILYWLTGLDLFSSLGGVWILAGGVLTTILMFWSATMFIMIPRQAENSRRGSVIYGWTALVCIVSYPAALGCLVMGGDLVERPKFVLRVHNTTSVPLDSVTVHFNDGDVSLGPISAGAFIDSGKNWLRHRGELSISVNVGGAIRKKVDRVYCDPGILKSSPIFDMLVEDYELPPSVLAPPATQRGGTR